MAVAPRSPQPEGEAPTPGWVYAVGIVLILLALGFVAMHFASGGIPSH
jgi:hypothetical protein